MTKQQKNITRFIPADEWLRQGDFKGFVSADEWLNDYSLPQSHNHDIAEPIEIKEDEEESYCSDEPNSYISSDHCSDHLNKINEAVILHHEGIKDFLNKYNDVQVIKAFHFEATDRFLIFCKDLKVKKKEEYCLFWWDWENRITTKSGDYIDCFLQYERLVDVMGNPKPISFPESPDLTAYYRNVTYCPADGKRCEQFTLSLGV